MNIIKFKDTLVDGQTWYNRHVRGKYAYWIHCRYVVEMKDITDNQCILFEQDVTNLLNSDIHYIDSLGNGNWVMNECDNNYPIEVINSTQKYRDYNSFIPDGDITIDELKKFRTWLATQLLTLKEWNEDDVHMLEYYKNRMYDNDIKWLTTFAKKTVSMSSVSNSCGCCGNSDLSSLYNDSLSICDPVEIYRLGIKNTMVDLFSEIDTWKDLPITFLTEFKQYIDGILQYNFSFENNFIVTETYKCECLSDGETSDSVAKGILKQLSIVLSYLINKEISGHKNLISNTLNSWSYKLYELMEWN